MSRENLRTARPNKCMHQTKGARSGRFAGSRWSPALPLNAVFDGPLWGGADGEGGLRSHSGAEMQNYSFVVERDADTGLYVGHIPGWPGAHSQGETLDELQGNLQEVIAMLLEDGAPKFESEFVGVQTIKVA